MLKSLLFKDEKNLYPESSMKPLRLLAIQLLYLAVILTFLANIARPEGVDKTTNAKTHPSKSARFIQFANDLLTVKVQDMSLKELFQEIAHQGGLSIVAYGSLDEKITIQFDQLPFDEGMRLILWHHNYILSYTQQKPGERQSSVTRSRKLSIFSKAEKGHPIKTTAIDGSTHRESLKDVAIDIQKLQAALMSEDSWEREEAAEALGESRRAEALRPLRMALEDIDEDVREAAAVALASIGGDEAAQALAIALQDEDCWVREAAVEALGEIGGKTAAQVLAIALQNEDSSIREEAVEALGEIGGKTAISLLEQALSDKDESVRETAADILAKIKDKIR